MTTTITHVETCDVRFPTAQSFAGSDAMHPNPDYSAAYVILHTDHPDGINGHGMTFTIGRGNEVCCRAIEALAPLVTGLSLKEIILDMRSFWRRLTSDPQLRWIGPEKGVIHLATAAVVNAVWDLWAKVEGKPLWKLLVDLSPEELVGCIDFRYLTDALTPEEAITLLHRQSSGKSQREAQMRQEGYPAYTTSAGWIGYSDEYMRQLIRDGIAAGWTHFKLKVGGNPNDDIRRTRIMREEIGDNRVLMLDANQRWDVPEAITTMKALAPYQPWWIEEPTSPDDVLGHATIAQAIAPIRVATGEMVQNRVMFKQFLQSSAIGICQIDACRVGGVNEVLAILLLAAKFQVPVCPHAGGVGLCEMVQHLSLFDYIAVSASLEGRMIEHAPHLHEHFRAPAIVVNGRYQVPMVSGYSTEMWQESLALYTFPDGEAWQHH